MTKEVTVPQGISPALWDALVSQNVNNSAALADIIRRLTRIETKLCKLMAANKLDGNGQPIVVKTSPK